jgi:hypothetical protein
MRRTVSSGFLVVSLCAAGSAWGQSADIDRCNDVLRQDLFDRLERSYSTSATDASHYWTAFYSLDEGEAYNRYKAAYDSRLHHETSGSGGYAGSIGIINAEFDNTYDRELSRDEFKAQFTKKRAERQSASAGSSDRETKVIAIERSTTRNAASIQAWERCMSRVQEPGVYAYGYRDPSGDPYVVVMWLAGAFATARPSVRVTFPQQSDGMSIVGARDGVNIGTGTGTAFPIRFGSEQDARAKEASFTVLVNGEVGQSGQSLNSFRAEAVIPAHIGPVSCRRVFSAGQTYQLAMQSEPSETLEWETFHLEASDETPDRLVAIFPKAPVPLLGRMVLEFTGLEATLAVVPPPRATAASPAPVVAISCTSAGVMARPAALVAVPGARAFLRPAR